MAVGKETSSLPLRDATTSKEKADRSSPMDLDLFPDRFAVCRLDPGSTIPRLRSCFKPSFLSVTQTDEEISLVCREDEMPDGVSAEPNWRCLKVRGPLDFSEIGVLAGIAQPLADARISLFCISTFDTDYILVKQDDILPAIRVLNSSGHRVIEPHP